MVLIGKWACREACPCEEPIILTEVLSCLRKSGVDARLVLVGRRRKDRIAIQNRAACLGLFREYGYARPMDSSLAYQGFDAFAFPVRTRGLAWRRLRRRVRRLAVPAVRDAITREVDVTGACVSCRSMILRPGRGRYALCVERPATGSCASGERFSYYDIDAAAQKLCSVIHRSRYERRAMNPLVSVIIPVCLTLSRTCRNA